MTHLIKVVDYNKEYVLTPTDDAILVYEVYCYRIVKDNIITMYEMCHETYEDAYNDALKILHELNEYADLECSLTIKYDKYHEFK